MIERLARAAATFVWELGGASQVAAERLDPTGEVGAQGPLVLHRYDDGDRTIRAGRRALEQGASLLVLDCVDLEMSDTEDLNDLARALQTLDTDGMACLAVGLSPRALDLIGRWWPESGLRLVTLAGNAHAEQGPWHHAPTA